MPNVHEDKAADERCEKTRGKMPEVVFFTDEQAVQTMWDVVRALIVFALAFLADLAEAHGYIMVGVALGLYAVGLMVMRFRHGIAKELKKAL